ncbi:hypothetical protein GCM10010371_65950 [Streptomyces subrutilus]|uniref:Uncharacterized protein n=1 Tax=Streptomyces subrutilus TaxID=36818 RepID=A0A918RGB0_9ACTN|nr:hypothetical protein [Streptomyces subrutilus]GGZ96834.1 hypothetical protein GCM10010371_65950 [Streptomyces subrutilus]
MYRVVRTAAYAALLADRADRDQAHADRDQTMADLRRALDDLAEIRDAGVEEQRVLDDGLREVIRQVTAARDAARAELDAARIELEAARAQVLLDAEDRVALRALLRMARKQHGHADRVYALYRYGALHSLHRSMEVAEQAAEAVHPPRGGWTASRPGAALPPAAEVDWRIQPLALSTP